MFSRILLPAVVIILALPAAAQEAPAPLAQPVPPAALPAEPPPGFDPLKPPEGAVPAAQEASPAPEAAPSPAPAAAPAVTAVAQPVAAAPAAPAGMPGWAVAVVLLLGAFLAGLFGVMTATILRRGEMAQRRRAAAATLAIELETRRLAFEAVPLPPNAEAGVSFVSATTALAGIDAGFRTAQVDLHLLPEKLAAHVSVHYAAVQRVSDFVKGQSLAAAVRMLQANRIGGYPCPDAGTMREAHEELSVAFRGTDKLVANLKSVR